MAIDGTKVRANYGTLTYTPDGGSAKALGFMVEGIRLKMEYQNEPILTEDFGEIPLDYIMLGGPIIVSGLAMQWDDPTRHALAEQEISASDLVFTTSNIGRKLGDIAFGVLVFAPANTGHAGFTIPKAVPLLNEDQPFEISFRKREEARWAFAFAALPPAAGGTIITINEPV